MRARCYRDRMPHVRTIAVVVTAVTSLLATAFVAAPAAESAPKRYTSCASLLKAYPSGVATTTRAAVAAVNDGKRRPAVRAGVYAASSPRLDPDRDGVMCEVVRPKPVAPVTPATEPYVAPTTPGAPASTCQLLDTSNERRIYGNIPGGFPRQPYYVKQPGVLKMALIPIDWADQPGEADPLGRVADQMTRFTDWYDMVSEGRLKVEWVSTPNWVRLPGAAQDYVISQSSYFQTGTAPERMAKLAGAAIAAADPSFDFSGVDVVAFVLPKTQNVLEVTAQGFQYQSTSQFPTAEGLINRFVAAGRYFDVPYRTFWAYWAHEVGHMLLLPHIGSSTASNPMQGFDLMGSQDAPSRTLSAWLRYLIGWLSDEQIYCQAVDALAPTSVMLNPIDDRGPGVKAAMVRTSPTTLLVVESRRKTAFACTPDGRLDGVLVYTYDSTLGHSDEMLKPAIPAGRGSGGSSCGSRYDDALLSVGDAVTVDGVTVSVTKSGRYDTVSITRG